MSTFYRVLCNDSSDFNIIENEFFRCFNQSDNQQKRTVDEIDLYSEEFAIYYKKSSETAKFRSEDYKLKFNCSFTISPVISKKENEILLYRFIGYLLKKLQGDFVFEFNGDTPVVIRRDEDVLAQSPFVSISGMWQSFCFVHLAPVSIKNR